MIQFTIPIHEKVSTNAIWRKHWAYRKRLTDEYHLAVLPLKGKISCETFPVKVTYDFRWKGVALDCSNCSALQKLLEDGLVAIGLFPSDTPKHVAQVSLRSRKGKVDEVTITIEPFARAK
jgi:hypothetical protein